MGATGFACRVVRAKLLLCNTVSFVSSVMAILEAFIKCDIKRNKMKKNGFISEKRSLSDYFFG